jgi:predicted nucleic acid-binding protein
VADYLLDTCVLIRHLRRHQLTTDLLSDLALQGELGVATITRVEIVEGMRAHERQDTLRLLDSLISYTLDNAIADLSGEFIRRYRVQGVTLDKPDAIIGATAVRHGLILVTYNSRHFPMRELRLHPELPEAS